MATKITDTTALKRMNDAIAAAQAQAAEQKQAAQQQHQAAANGTAAQNQTAQQQQQQAATAETANGTAAANQQTQNNAAQTVATAQQTLQNLQTSRPMGYVSKYQTQMDELLQRIQNPDKFTWDFNGDELFKLYADEYTQRGKQASMDVIGQAAALTGGYGNTYAQQVANQTYDQYLTQLYDKGLELRDRAYEQWLNGQQDLYNQYNTLLSTDQLDWQKMTDEQQYAAQYAMQILANGEMPSEALLAAAGLSLEDAKKMLAKKTGGGGVGTKKKETTTTTSNGLEGMAYDDAARYVLQNTPLNVTPYNTDRTVLDLMKQVALNDASKELAAKESAKRIIQNKLGTTNGPAVLDGSGYNKADQLKKKITGK